MSRHIAAGSALIAAAALFAAGCGSDASNSANTAATQPAKKTAKSINSALVFTVAGSDVTVAVTGKQGTPASDLPAQIVCANLASDGFKDRNEASLTWKKASTSASVTLPESAAAQDLCAISFTTLKKQAVAFFNEEAKKRYLEDAQAAE
ncbi:MAG: hypothetical protein NWQ82_07670 [Solirubrobacteraceae bacterium]|jgi:hypothetical protein|nr:hypothetical protein [Solirubrobacteraceae bacterium]MDP4672085.1 hypothetical protein [Solirubrobacteraceae bacterium]MDP4921827.1 hypothetical protein [Solirubrobacteraceae bacterium]